MHNDVAGALRAVLDKIENPPKPDKADLIPVQVSSARFVTIELASKLTGYTPGAIRAKIIRGVWLMGREYWHSPDGRVLVDMKGYEQWVLQKPAT